MGDEIASYIGGDVGVGGGEDAGGVVFGGEVFEGLPRFGGGAFFGHWATSSSESGRVGSPSAIRAASGSGDR
jgi:hypothetical protein